MRKARITIAAGLSLALAPCLGLSQIAQQAAPVIPQTPEVVVPKALTLPAPEIDAGRKPLSIQEAVAVALSHQPLIGIATGNLEYAQGQTELTSSALRPQLSGTGGYSDQRYFRGTPGGTSQSLTAGANVSQLLFDFGRTRDFVRMESAYERASRESLNDSKRTVTLQVKQAFYDLVQGRANVALSEADLANRQRQLDEARARVSAGIGAPSDLLQAKTNLAESAIALSSARDVALNAQVTLAQDLGIDARTPLIPAASSEDATPSDSSLSQMVQFALSHRPDVQSARETLSGAVYGVAATRKGNLPIFSVTAGYGGVGPSDPLSTQTGSLGLNVTWTFADGGLLAGEIRSARGTAKVAQQNLLLVSQQAVSDVSKAFLDLESARQRQTLSAVEVSNAQELVRISEGRYEGGLGQFLDITNAQSSLVAAQRNSTQAEGDIQRALVRLRGALGLER